MNRALLRKLSLIIREFQKVDDHDVGANDSFSQSLSRLLEQVDECEDIEDSDVGQFIRTRDNIEIMNRAGSGDKSLLGDLPEIIERALTKPIPISESRFPTVSDTVLRNILDRDLTDAETCLSRGLWKSSMVMCGSILEAVLYEFLRRNPAWTMDISRSALPKVRGTAKDIMKEDMDNQWSLEQLIEFFCENRLLDSKPETWKTTLHNFIRRYRNLVHPMAEMRKQANQQVSMEAAQQCYGNLIAALAILGQVPTPV